MNRELIFLESGTKKIIDYINNLGRGSIICVNELRKLDGISYTSIRSILVHLCDNNTLLRISRGVYCFPNIDKDGESIFPTIKTILDKIEQSEEITYCPIGEYSEYLLGITEKCPKNIVCYTTGKIKQINITDGTTIKFQPTRKHGFSRFKSFELMILNQYVTNIGISNLRVETIQYLETFIHKLATPIIQSELYKLNSEVRKLLSLAS